MHGRKTSVSELRFGSFPGVAIESLLRFYKELSKSSFLGLSQVLFGIKTMDQVWLGFKYRIFQSII